MEQLKTNNIAMSNVVEVQPNKTEIKTNGEGTSKGIKEPTHEPTKKETKKHVVTYIGNGEYKDITGRRWTRGDKCTYADNEYDSRKDLHFMINYGEMEHTEITM